jgi:hypothetical protein
VVLASHAFADQTCFVDEFALARFEAKVSEVPEVGCWIWTASLTPLGYGKFFLAGRLRAAHRASYEHFRGPIPEGLCLDHLCRTPSCVNPWHLDPVTLRENSIRGLAGVRIRTRVCAKGHEIIGENVKWITTRGGYRTPRCRQCDNAQHSARYRALFPAEPPRMTCPHGHERGPGNTFYSKAGAIRCRSCERARGARRRTARRRAR